MNFIALFLSGFFASLGAFVGIALSIYLAMIPSNYREYKRQQHGTPFTLRQFIGWYNWTVWS